jgi:hypothetical protein
VVSALRLQADRAADRSSDDRADDDGVDPVAMQDGDLSNQRADSYSEQEHELLDHHRSDPGELGPDGSLMEKGPGIAARGPVFESLRAASVSPIRCLD